MKSLEDILKEEENLRKAKELYYCLCYATTGTVCTICKCHMDMDDNFYASCDPTCKIANMSKNQLIELAHASAGKKGAYKNNKFVTFTRPGKEKEDHLQLFKVLMYIKKAKAIKNFWYSFEYQENGNPHLHCVIHMKDGYYFRDIARTLIKNNAGGYMDEQTQKGTDEESQKYLYKDIEKTENIIKNMSENYFFANNIKLNSK